MTARRQEVLNELAVLKDKVAVINGLIDNEEVMKKMGTMRDPKALNKYLTEESGVNYIKFVVYQNTWGFHWF